MKKANHSKVQNTGEVALKMIELQEGNPSKTTLIGTGLNVK
jgi:hypothetical protein